MDYGIDYGNGITNVNPETGIRYGVINQNAVLQTWADSAEGDYGDPTCPKCGNSAVDADEFLDTEGFEEMGGDYGCPDCRYLFDSDEAYGDEPLGYVLEGGEYRAQSDESGDVFIVDSPYYTHAQYCSPCAPGACHLETPVDEDGPKAYCFAPDWFDWWPELGECAGEYNGRKTACPYPVYRVADGVCVYRPNEA